MAYFVVLAAIALRVVHAFRKSEVGRFERLALLVEGLGHLMLVLRVG